MQKTTFLTLMIVTLMLLSSCSKEPTTNENLDNILINAIEEKSPTFSTDYFLFPSDVSSIPQDINNPITSAKIELGKLLYHETGLGLNPENEFDMQTYSCASCHHAAAGFQANLPQGIGEGGLGFGHSGEMRRMNVNCQIKELDVQPVRTPTTLNSAFQKNMLWNGQFGATGHNVGTESLWAEGTPIFTNFTGYEGVEIQAIAGLTVHRMIIDPEFLNQYVTYKNMFEDAFPMVPEEDRMTAEHAGLAIAAYERTLLASEAPFQKWLQGDLDAMTEQQKQGAILYFNKANCTQCHTGPALNVNEFIAIGMGDLQGPGVYRFDPNDPAHTGRASFTGNNTDMYKFKVPQLYNLKDSPFLGHGSSFRSVREVIEYKNAGVVENPNVTEEYVDDRFVPLGLNDTEIDQLTAFVEEALYDANLERYVPESLPSGLCFPNNDMHSRADLGCD